MRPSRNRHDASALDSDHAFAAEPEPRIYGPKSILPEPSDEFADEPPAGPVNLTSVPVPVPSARLSVPEEPLLRVPPVADPGRLYRPRTPSPPAGEFLIPVLQGVAALVSVVAFTFLVVLPNRQRSEEPSTIADEAPAAAAPAAAATPSQPGSPERLRPEPTDAQAPRTQQPVATAILPASAAATLPPARSTPTADVKTPIAPEPQNKGAETQKTAQLARLTPDPKKSADAPKARAEPISSPAPAAAEADQRRAAPALDVRRLESSPLSVVGQPVATPAAEVVAPPSPNRSPVVPEPPAARSAPSGTAGASTVDVRTVERDKVRSVLSRYESAYSQLDAAAAARLYPGVDRKALSRAFNTLSAQQIQFNDCRILVTQATARATCAGTASWTPKVGGGPKEQARRWQFDLKQVSGEWQIGSVRVQ
jgi:hypothetical protein